MAAAVSYVYLTSRASHVHVLLVSTYHKMEKPAHNVSTHALNSQICLPNLKVYTYIMGHPVHMCACPLGQNLSQDQDTCTLNFWTIHV